jgi:hypothetical protein
MADNVFYVGIKDPVQVRRLLLECSKQILESLQDYEQILLLREEKIKRMMELRHIVKEICSLSAEINKVLPNTQLRAIKKEPSVHMKRRHELKSFQSELDAIENKLNSLGV